VAARDGTLGKVRAARASRVGLDMTRALEVTCTVAASYSWRCMKGMSAATVKSSTVETTGVKSTAVKSASVETSTMEAAAAVETSAMPATAPMPATAASRIRQIRR
jgi:hypothetical protein